MADFHERIYVLGTETLAEQERQVAELRGRGATLLAAGAVIASLLAKAIFAGNHQPEARRSSRHQSGWLRQAR